MNNIKLPQLNKIFYENFLIFTENQFNGVAIISKPPLRWLSELTPILMFSLCDFIKGVRSDRRVVALVEHYNRCGGKFAIAH